MDTKRPKTPVKPMAPAPDAAQLRAENLTSFFPQLGRATLAAGANVLGLDGTTRAAAADLGANIAGGVTGVLGATDTSAGMFRQQEAARQQFMSAAQQANPLAGLFGGGQPAAQAPAPNDPTTEAPQSGVQVTNLSSPENAAAMQQLRPQQVLSELNTTQLQALQSTLPEMGTPMAPKDRTIEDVRQIAFGQYEQVLNDETASVEMKAAATRELLATLLELTGANSFAAMAGQ